MVKIKFIEHSGQEHAVEANTGASVMIAAVSNGVPGIDADCGGACSCATCHVYVDETWQARLPEPTDEEIDMLDNALEVEDNSRLSCQIIFNPEYDGLKVTLAPEDM